MSLRITKTCNRVLCPCRYRYRFPIWHSFRAARRDDIQAMTSTPALPGLRRCGTSDVVNLRPAEPNELVFDASGAQVVDGSGGSCTIAVDCNLDDGLFVLRLLEGTCQLVTSAPRVLAPHVPNI